MKNPLNIEDIESLRLRQGIDDVELRKEVRGLGPGDCVRLTFLGDARPHETLMVRITSTRGTSFRGRLIQRPTKGAPYGLRLGAMLAFAATHIHSVVKVGEEGKDT